MFSLILKSRSITWHLLEILLLSIRTYAIITKQE